jgi:enoyl-CoA hydratase
MAADLVLVEGGPVTTVTVNRPQARNALDADTLDALFATFTAIGRDGGVRCVILTGAGDRAFVAGADIKAMAGLDVAGARAFAERGHRLATLLEGLNVPVIAAVNGFALGGGCELALACDFIYASRTAKLGLPEVGLGVIPGLGGTPRLLRRVGAAKTRELLYTGATIDAEEALRIGLVNAVTEPDALLGRARATADEIAAKAPQAIAAAKAAIRRQLDVTVEAGVEVEGQLFSSLFGTHDQKEGMRAFIEKRPPTWTGR